MKYSGLKELKDVTYYSIILFKNKDKTGESYGKEYKKLNNAFKKFDELKKSGLFECVILRKHEIFLRNANNEFSSHSVVERFGE